MCGLAYGFLGSPDPLFECVSSTVPLLLGFRDHRVPHDEQPPEAVAGVLTTRKNCLPSFMTDVLG